MSTSATTPKTSAFSGALISWLPKLGVITFLSVFALLANIWAGSTEGEHDRQYVNISGELRVLSQRIAKNAPEAAAGNEEAYNDLRIAKDNFDAQWRRISKGSDQDLPTPNDEAINQHIKKTDAIWVKVKHEADKILLQAETIAQLSKTEQEMATLIPEIQERYELVAKRLLSAGGTASEVRDATNQVLFAERMLGNVQKIVEGGDAASAARDLLIVNAKTFDRVLKGMLEGDAEQGISAVRDTRAKATLVEIDKLFSQLKSKVDFISNISEDLREIRSASENIFVDTRRLLQATEKLVEAFNSAPLTRVWGGATVNIVAGSISALCMFLLVIGIRAENKRRLEETRIRLDREAEANKENQEAIMRLLNEMDPLSDGDLTVTATVTEDFTGAIADSVNYTIEALRTVVSTINDTVTRVADATDETLKTAKQLTQAAEHQAQEIAGASAAINEMAVSIEQVSANAAESATVAQKSVEISKKGADVVSNTITGMDNIREHIQETSKRIKRLGESSQEIGDIVSLINDIADQTNILALNAAIQAAMAGEAGRGFAVVADEVQRLAERSSNATKQIEALVKTIQTDTNEAVISMEQSTAEVVSGARLAQDAGVALEEIENVSHHLADLIQNISNAAKQQAASAGHISNTMNVIQEITTQTSSGTQNTENSIGKLVRLTEELRDSTSGFKLPE